jgi:hypothetical protein
MKNSQATSHVNWLNGEKTNVSRTISLLVFRVLMYLENQSVSDIGLPEFHVHDALANGSCWFVSKACFIRPASCLDSMFITGCQAWLNMRPQSVLEVFIVQSDANGLFHKMIHIARRSVRSNGMF